MKKVVWLLVVLAVLAGGLFIWHERSGPTPPEKITLINPLGPLVIPVTGITGQQVKGETPINVQFWNDTDEAVSILASKRADFAVLPITNAANMYARGINITMLGVHEWKVFYLVAAPNTPFEGWKSLAGKNVYTAHGRGQTVDVLMRAALSKEGIDPDQDVKISYAPPQEIVALFKSGKADFVALPEPFVTLAIAGEKGKIVVDFQKYWGESTGKPERLPIAGLFVTKEFAAKYPEQTKEVAQVLANSIEWSNQHVDQAIDLAGKTLPLPQPVLKASMSRVDFHYLATKDSKAEVEFFLQKMNELYPQGTPKLPDQGFYTE